MAQLKDRDRTRKPSTAGRRAGGFDSMKTGMGSERMGARLDVPLVRQPYKSNICGFAGLSMIYKFYGMDASVSDLKSRIELHPIGTYAPQLGLDLLSNDFDVDIVTYNPYLVCKAYQNLSQEGLLKEFEARYRKVRLKRKPAYAKIKLALRYFIDFMNAGGRVTVKLPDRSDITGEIDSGRPMAALLTTRFLNSKRPVFNFHFVVVTGYSGDTVYTNDPLWRPGKKENWGVSSLTFDELSYAITASAFGDLDNACLIKIRRKS
ncbi:Peptidase_C39 like family protein [uncultured archaeon]|nr:Peptidase_C39 like family protein [uncultured archaeon]